MTNQPSRRSAPLSRRLQCESGMRNSVRLLTEHATLFGWTREEALIAISDAADAELADLTETLSDGARRGSDIAPPGRLRH